MAEAAPEGEIVEPEPVPVLDEESLANRKEAFEAIFADCPALEIKQKATAERKAMEAPPPADEEAEGGAPPPEIIPKTALTYSEVDLDFVNNLVNMVKEQCGPLFAGKGMFLDFGSGAGKACVAAGLVHPFEKVVGIETLQCLNDAANASLAKYAEAQLPEGVVKPEIQFIKGDFVTDFEANLDAIAPEVAVCLCVATCFGEPEMQALKKLASKLPEKAVLLTVGQKLPEELLIDVNKAPRQRRAKATKEALSKRGVEPVGIEVVLAPAENDPNGWKLVSTQSVEMMWGTSSCYLFKKYTYPFCDVGDVCLATPPPEENDTTSRPALFASPTSAVYFEDGCEQPCEVSNLAPFTNEDLHKVFPRWTSVANECKAAEGMSSDKCVAAAIEHAKKELGECDPPVTDEENRFQYDIAEGTAGYLIAKQLATTFGSVSEDPKFVAFVAAKWLEACKEVDEAATGLIDEALAITVWDKIKTAPAEMANSRLQKLKQACPEVAVYMACPEVAVYMACPEVAVSLRLGLCELNCSTS
eukprot:TRINITY_DN2153_c0_g1_i1.p1 TRINITY_DN2153_c0_g1~~TRINITY_DN2153_c0_g1_i1.p1  ORF type:complete len:559 (+),score=162.60 TRINITY_DN2153_c0_g1_i1:90-1679(+)